MRLCGDKVRSAATFELKTVQAEPACLFQHHRFVQKRRRELSGRRAAENTLRHRHVLWTIQYPEFTSPHLEVLWG